MPSSACWGYLLDGGHVIDSDTVAETTASLIVRLRHTTHDPNA